MLPLLPAIWVTSASSTPTHPHPPLPACLPLQVLDMGSIGPGVVPLVVASGLRVMVTQVDLHMLPLAQCEEVEVSLYTRLQSLRAEMTALLRGVKVSINGSKLRLSVFQTAGAELQHQRSKLPQLLFHVLQPQLDEQQRAAAVAAAAAASAAAAQPSLAQPAAWPVLGLNPAYAAAWPVHLKAMRALLLQCTAAELPPRHDTTVPALTTHVKQQIATLQQRMINENAEYNLVIVSHEVMPQRLFRRSNCCIATPACSSAHRSLVLLECRRRKASPPASPTA